jgi:hypothetical protein
LEWRWDGKKERKKERDELDGDIAYRLRDLGRREAA